MNFEFSNPHTISESFFWFCAIVGTIIFIIRMLLNIIGFGFEDQIGDTTSGQSDDAFHIFSLHSLSGFFMLFGWSGLASLIQFSLPIFASSLIALIMGSFMLLLTHLIFKAAKNLISKGDQFILDDSIGRQGVVYQQIPANGVGTIQVSVNNIMRELDAVSENRIPIPSFCSVQVVHVISEKVVAVKSLPKELKKKF